MNNLIGQRVLITKGKNSGQHAHIAYVYWRHATESFCQMNPSLAEGWERIIWVVPIFDHCGKPKIVELKKGEFAFA